MTTKPNNITRGYYSPNATIQEGYYKGASTNVVVVIKTSIANAIGFASRARNVTRAKFSQSVVASLAIAFKNTGRAKTTIVNGINLVNIRRNLSRSRLFYAIQSSLALTGRNFKRSRTSTANATNLIKVLKTRVFIKASKSIVTGFISNIKSARRIKTVLVNAIGYIRPSRIDHFFRFGTARLAQLASTKRRFALIRAGRAVAINLVSVIKFRSKLLKAFASAIPLARVFKNKTQHRVSGPIQIVTATITRTKGRHRSAAVTVTYEIGSTKTKTLFRKAIATAVGLYKYSLRRVANIRSKESAVVQPVNLINFYVTPNNVDVAGNYTAGTDQPSDYAEPTNNPGDEYSIEKDQPADYNEPNFPSGEDVVPS